MVYERRRGRGAAGTVTSRRRSEGINGHRRVAPQRPLDLGLARGRPSDRLGRLDHPVERAGAVPLIRISFQPLRTADRTIDGVNLPADAEVTPRPFGICAASFRG